MKETDRLIKLIYQVGNSVRDNHPEGSVLNFCCAAPCDCGRPHFILSDEPGGEPIGDFTPGRVAKGLRDIGAERYFFLQVLEPGGKRNYYLEAVWITRERPCEAEKFGQVTDEGPFSVLLVDLKSPKEEKYSGKSRGR